jgi:hypothetical protein
MWFEPSQIPAESEVQQNSSYRHTQRGLWGCLLTVLGIPLLALGWFVRIEHPGPIILTGVGLVFMALAPCFHHLTVADEGDRLAVRFGPVPFFQTSIQYQDIQNVEIGRTWLIEGWGIHMLSPRRGMVWNIWGRECVVIRHTGIIRVGTNDAQDLLAFLKSK